MLPNSALYRFLRIAEALDFAVKVLNLNFLKISSRNSVLSFSSPNSSGNPTKSFSVAIRLKIEVGLYRISRIFSAHMMSCSFHPNSTMPPSVLKFRLNRCFWWQSFSVCVARRSMILLLISSNSSSLMSANPKYEWLHSNSPIASRTSFLSSFVMVSWSTICT